eukprot:1625555-Pyramimonas_sp.AAC.1
MLLSASCSIRTYLSLHALHCPRELKLRFRIHATARASRPRLAGEKRSALGRAGGSSSSVLGRPPPCPFLID